MHDYPGYDFSITSEERSGTARDARRIGFPVGEDQYTRLCFMLLDAAKIGDEQQVQELLNRGAPIDFADPVTGATALHYAAAYAARPVLRVLLRHDRCNFLVRDNRGRLPSQLARQSGRDPAMARLLLIKEIRQAQARGIDPGSLYRRYARKPGSSDLHI
jgi:ankyrin repeat protein